MKKKGNFFSLFGKKKPTNNINSSSKNSKQSQFEQNIEYILNEDIFKESENKIVFKKEDTNKICLNLGDLDEFLENKIEGKPLQCKKCSSAFSSISNFNEKDKSWKCEFCNFENTEIVKFYFFIFLIFYFIFYFLFFRIQVLKK
jgi:hypothetical protein